MTQPTSFDAFALWKEMYDKTESAWRDVIQETLEKPAFSEGLGKVQTSYLQYQEMVNKATEGYLKQLNIPTKEDIANMATLIINIEAKVDDLADQLDDSAEGTDKEVVQLSKTVARLEKKLDTITELLSKVPAQSTAPVSTAKKATEATK